MSLVSKRASKIWWSTGRTWRSNHVRQSHELSELRRPFKFHLFMLRLEDRTRITTRNRLPYIAIAVPPGNTNTYNRELRKGRLLKQLTRTITILYPFMVLPVVIEVYRDILLGAF